MDISPVAILCRLRDAAPKEIKVEILPAPGETARYNLRFRIVNGAADQAVLAVLERDHIAIRGISKNFQDLTGKNPIVSVQNSRTRFDNDSGHRKAENVEHPTSNVQYRMQKFIGRSAFGVGRSAFRNASSHAIFNRS